MFGYPASGGVCYQVKGCYQVRNVFWGSCPVTLRQVPCCTWRHLHLKRSTNFSTLPACSLLPKGNDIKMVMPAPSFPPYAAPPLSLPVRHRCSIIARSFSRCQDLEAGFSR
ncbi:hypothetical protein J6590_035527 [Homalodisca vitripennis]|nr:hypothetical protein J6590_035527 [Homalodisca vitripennis]